MNEDEREIFQFLKTWGAAFVSGGEIARRASTKKRFHADPHWAKPILQRMVERGILESDIQGRYRIKPVRRKKNEPAAPEVAAAEEGSTPISTAAATSGDEVAEDEYYERL